MLTNIMLSFTDAEAPRDHVAYSLATFDVPPLPPAHPGTIFSASMYKHRINFIRSSNLQGYQLPVPGLDRDPTVQYYMSCA